jgi:salicylate hydroxylase
VVAYDDNEPSLTLSNGEVHKADVIIAADGEC